MKKILLLVMLLSSSFTLKALPIGNPAEPAFFYEHLFLNPNCWGDCSCVALGVGYYGDFTYNRHLQADVTPEGTISVANLFTNAGVLSLTFCNRFEVYGLVGATVLNMSSTDFSFIPTLPNTNDLLVVEGSTSTSWGAGARWLVWQCGCLSAGLEGEYFYVDSQINSIASTDTPVSYIEDTFARYHEWQIGGAFAYEVPLCYGTSLIPYIGVKWSQVHVDIPSTLGSFTGFVDLENNRHWGWGFGLSLIGVNRLSVTAEGRFADEKALFIQFLLSI